MKGHQAGKSGFIGRFEAWLSAGATPAQLADPIRCERVRNVGLGSLVAFFGFVGELIEGLRLGIPVITGASVVAVVCFALILLWLRRSQAYAIAGHAVLCTVLIAMTANLLVSGGFANPAIVAIFIMPIGAAVLINVGASLAWGAVSFAVLFGFWISANAGLDLGTVPGGADGVNALVNRGLVLGGIIIMISLFVRGQTRAEQRIRAAFEDLADKSTHLTLLMEAAVAANEAATLNEALEEVLRAVCVSKGWPLAHAYDLTASSDDPVPARSVLYVADTVAPDKRIVRDAFRLLADGSAESSNSELPTVGELARWDSNQTNSANPYRRALAVQLGLSDRILAVIDIGDRQWVLEFFSREALRADDAFIDLLRATGTQLGRVLERSRSRSRIHDLSYSDALTGLPNRRHLNESLDRVLVEKSDDRMVALLQIGLDRFQVVNDALGHDVGDKLLRKVADRLLGVVAGASNRGDGTYHSDRVFRLGGDEFAVLLEDSAAPSQAGILAAKILERLAEPMQVTGREIFTTASVGISISSIDAPSGLGLLRCADSALAAAKKAGGSKVRFYASSLNEESSRRHFIENRLRRAIARSELSLAYQPMISAPNGDIVSAEALLRWTTSDGQRIAPDEFIPVAEATGQIGALGRWVLENATTQLARWRSANKGPSRIAVNVSVEQLREHDFVDFVLQLIDRLGLPPGALELEITESRLIGSEPEVFERLEQLRDAGATLALDDFGTGYSSLGQLRRLPIEKLKIDRSFVDGIEGDAGNLALVEAVVQIGRNLGLTIVAEGVENAAQAAILREAGADELQGYHFSRPLSAEHLEATFEPHLRPTLRGMAPLLEPAVL